MLILMFVTSFWMMCATLLVLNTISEAFRPASSVSIRMNSSEEDRTRAFSLFRVFVNLAVTIALSLGGFLIGFGWKWIFICDAITCFGAAFLLFWQLPKEKNKPKTVTQKADFQLINKDSALRDKDFVLFVLLTFLSAVVFMQIVWTVPPFFKQVYGWSESKIGVISAINGLVVMLVEMPLIFQIQDKKSTGWYIRLGLVLYGLSYLALTLPIGGAVLWAILYMVVISFGEIFLMPFSSTWVTRRAPENRQGQYIALYTMAYSVSNVVAPLLGTQIIAHFGFDALWISLGLISAVAWLGFWKLRGM
jgi:predicted MFS family arabinose efflux permease